MPNEWTLICSSCGWRYGFPKAIQDKLEADGFLTEGTTIELMDKCKQCGEKKFILKLFPKVVSKTSVPTAPTQSGEERKK